MNRKQYNAVRSAARKALREFGEIENAAAETLYVSTAPAEEGALSCTIRRLIRQECARDARLLGKGAQRRETLRRCAVWLNTRAFSAADWRVSGGEALEALVVTAYGCRSARERVPLV